MKNKKKLIYKSLLAGLLIGLAACIYVSINQMIIGSLMFSIGLIAVILLDAYLFTGKIGYVDSKGKMIDALIGLLFNLLASFVVGLLFRLCLGTREIINFKLVYSWYSVIFKGIITGALIYLAVELYKKTQNIILIILPVMAFILSGSLHCIAEAAYIGMCRLDINELFYLLLVVIGNSIGSLLIRFVQKISCTD